MRHLQGASRQQQQQLQVLQAAATATATVSLEDSLSLPSAESALHAAVQSGNTDAVQLLLLEHPALTSKLTGIGRYQALRKLADPNAVSSTGLTPLMLAARTGHVAITQLLLSAGAAVSASIPTTGQRALHFAAQHGSTAVVHLLLSALSDVDAVDFQGVTALQLAAHLGHNAVVQELLLVGADVSISSSTGATALMLAVTNRHTDIVVQLLKAGASPTAAAVQGLSAVQIAVQKGDEDVISAMVQHTQCLRETSALISEVWRSSLGRDTRPSRGKAEPLCRGRSIDRQQQQQQQPRQQHHHQQQQRQQFVKPGRLMIVPVLAEPQVAPNGASNCHHQLAAAVSALLGDPTPAPGIELEHTSSCPSVTLPAAATAAGSGQLLYGWGPPTPTHAETATASSPSSSNSQSAGAGPAAAPCKVLPGALGLQHMAAGTSRGIQRAPGCTASNACRATLRVSPFAAAAQVPLPPFPNSPQPLPAEAAAAGPLPPSPSNPQPAAVAAAAAAETVEDVLQSLTALELSLLALGMGKLELALRALEVADAKEVEQLLLFIEGQQVEQIQQQQQQQQQIASQCSWGSAASEELCGYTTAEFSLTA